VTNRIQFSDLILEKYVLNELSPVVRRQLEQALLTDEQLQQRVSDIKSSNQAFASQINADVMLAQIQRKQEVQTDSAKSANWRPVLTLVATVVIAVSILVLPVQKNDQLEYNPDGIDGVRLKGLEPELKLYRKMIEGAERLSANSIVHEGDVIQLGYVAADARYGMIFSIDGNAGITLHFPENAQSSSLLTTSGEAPLSHAYQLDDAPYFERFYFVTSSQPVPVAQLLQRLKLQVAEQVDVIKLDLPEAYRQFSFKLRKADE